MADRFARLRGVQFQDGSKLETEVKGPDRQSDVAVTEVLPGSAAALAGIDAGALILRVNREPVRSAAEFGQT